MTQKMNPCWNSCMGYMVYEQYDKPVYRKFEKKFYSNCLNCKRPNVEVRGLFGGVRLNDDDYVKDVKRKC